MSVKQRYRLAAKLARCIAAGGMTTVVACANPEEAHEPQTPQEQIERDVERLEALDVMAFGEVADVEQPAIEERAARLAAFTDLAESAVADIDADDISDQWQNEAGEPTLCVRGDSESFCLTIELHAENLQRVNALEIIRVDDIIRSDSGVTGFCYSSWETVNETDCVRGLKLGAIADLVGDEPE